MRELKFRVWDKEDEMYSGNWYAVNCLRSLDEGSNHVKEFKIIEQFTGLKDKDGVEIYEGDIVSGVLYKDYSEHIGKIQFDFNVYMIVTKDKSMQLDLPESLTVIGNIHQDNKLLEGE